MAVVVIAVLLAALIVVLGRMACSRAPDSRLRFLSSLLTTAPGAAHEGLKSVGQKETHGRNYAGRRHHRHRFGV